MRQLDEIKRQAAKLYAANPRDPRIAELQAEYKATRKERFKNARVALEKDTKLSPEGISKSMVEGMPQWERNAAAAGKSAMDFARGVGQLGMAVASPFSEAASRGLEASYQEEADTRERDAALMSDPGAQLTHFLGTAGLNLALPGGTAGTGATVAGPSTLRAMLAESLRLPNVAKRAAVGAGIGALPAVTTEAERLSNIQMGGAANVALPVAGLGLARGVQKARRALPEEAITDFFTRNVSAVKPTDDVAKSINDKLSQEWYRRSKVEAPQRYAAEDNPALPPVVVGDFAVPAGISANRLQNISESLPAILEGGEVSLKTLRDAMRDVRGKLRSTSKTSEMRVPYEELELNLENLYRRWADTAGGGALKTSPIVGPSGSPMQTMRGGAPEEMRPRELVDQTVAQLREADDWYRTNVAPLERKNTQLGKIFNVDKVSRQAEPDVSSVIKQLRDPYANVKLGKVEEVVPGIEQDLKDVWTRDVLRKAGTSMADTAENYGMLQLLPKSQAEELSGYVEGLRRMPSDAGRVDIPHTELSPGIGRTQFMIPPLARFRYGVDTPTQKERLAAVTNWLRSGKKSNFVPSIPNLYTSYGENE